MTKLCFTVFEHKLEYWGGDIPDTMSRHQAGTFFGPGEP
jgi:hypothetical protein